MWYEDLTRRKHFGKIFPAICTTIGWLENGKPFTKGKVSKEIVRKTYEFDKTPGMYLRHLGYHECDFCDFVSIELGATTLIVGYKNKVYVCPALIVHYIENHSYLPPSEFIEAVLNYDHKQAMEYFEKIRENKLIK